MSPVELLRAATRAGAAGERAYVCSQLAGWARRRGDFDGAVEWDEYATRAVDDVTYLLGTVSRPELRAPWAAVEELLHLDVAALELVECGHLYGAPDLLTLARAASAALVSRMPAAEHTS